MSASKRRSITLLVLAEMAGMSLWFTSAAVLPDMVAEGAITPTRQALLSAAVQAGFVGGALVVAVSGIADRFDPRRVFVMSAIGAAISRFATTAPSGKPLPIPLAMTTMSGITPSASNPHM